MNVKIIKTEEKKYAEVWKNNKVWDAFFTKICEKHGFYGYSFTESCAGHSFLKYAIAIKKPTTFLLWYINNSNIAEVDGPFDFDRFNYFEIKNDIKIKVLNDKYINEIQSIASELEHWGNTLNL
jgi:hypothetical protein